jgi:L-serine dehydratase
MTLSVFDLYSVGIGPSSSHTVGPMRAAKQFIDRLADDRMLADVGRVRAELFGSLGATGHGHGSDRAVILGLCGEDPATVDVAQAQSAVDSVKAEGTLALGGSHVIVFNSDRDLILHSTKSLPVHPNGMVFTSYDRAGSLLGSHTYYSVGGGFVVDESAVGADRAVTDTTPVRFPFTTAHGLLSRCHIEGLRISDVMLVNESAWRSEANVSAGLLHIWSVMKECVIAGRRNEGTLPGGLQVPRRAPALYRDLVADPSPLDALRVLDWVNLFALAVNEENAAGGRVVTAPTNGAAGIIPAVLHYYARFVPSANDEGVVRFLLTAAAIGILFKQNASISGAEVGCQGEVGSACSMAAGALAEALGGSPEQVENAAEIGIEHNLGLTCDPVGGLVQIPCIERNAIAAVKAINAARLALNGNGRHKVSLDKAIKTMRDTGRDMHVKYKETARGGLAVNVIEC